MCGELQKHYIGYTYTAFSFALLVKIMLFILAKAMQSLINFIASEYFLLFAWISRLDNMAMFMCTIPKTFLFYNS